MRAWLWFVAALAACGDPSQGILVSVTRDPATVETVDSLRFVIGVPANEAGTAWVRDAATPDVVVDVTGRDLYDDPYRLLVHDGGTAPRITVAVIGLVGQTAVAFGAFDQPQAFMAGAIVQRDVVLLGDVWFTTTEAGCVVWSGGAIVVDAGDGDCDGDPAATDCDDADPTRASTFLEVCDNGVDEDCDLTPDDGCVAGECTTPADCDPLYGPPPCGTWACNAGSCALDCPGCTDGDGDGYGMGADGACAGPDCDDADPLVTADAVAKCYTGPAGTEAVGTCQEGLQTCAGGVWGPCAGEVTPSGEACNGEDDDCDGTADDGLGTFSCGLGACEVTVPACSGGVIGTCTPSPIVVANDAMCNGIDDDCDGAIDENCACVHVATWGDDAAAVTDLNATPFATLQAAIDWAAATPAEPKIVCAASGATCGVGATYTGDVVMADGVSVYGRYESTTWTRCGGGTVTTIVPFSPEGVKFGPTVVSPTVLDGFKIDRHAATTTAGVTVDGATNVILSNLAIVNTPTVTNSYGINLTGGAAALITRSNIYAGNGTAEAIGVRAVGASPTIRDNCGAIDPADGHCTGWCPAGAPGIRGKLVAGSGVSFAVYLQDSPGAVIEQSALCGNEGDTGAQILVVGAAAGTVIRGNSISAWGGISESHGVWMQDCAGDAPWVVDNERIEAVGEVTGTAVDAVRAIGDCHPVIDGNELIVGGQEDGTAGTNAVHCGGGSRCAVLGNAMIQGAGFGFPPYAVGVRCDGGGCMRIAGNTIVGGSGVEVTGLWLEGAGPFVDDNDIGGGCAQTTATGVRAFGSWARLQNNRVYGGDCNTTGALLPAFFGLRVTPAPGVELDVHSNDIEAAGNEGPCTSVALRLDAAPGATTSSSGVYRNNILGGGFCDTIWVVKEAGAAADPRIFEHNDLYAEDSGAVLYLDEDVVFLTDVAAVNALPDMVTGGNISEAPGYASFPYDLHLTAGSACIGAGTSEGMPAYDMDGDPRDAVAPDIGADEL